MTAKATATAAAKTSASASAIKAPSARMRAEYNNRIRAELTKKFNYTNPMMVPKITKIVLNMGVGAGALDKKVIEHALSDMTKIAGQKPVVTKSRKSIAAFKLREGMPVGVKVTLRGEHMYEFLDRLITVALPRVRDFMGISRRAFDGAGNYSLGIKEQIIFPEIDFDKTDKIRGMDIVICTTAKNNDEAMALLEEFGMPFRKKMN